MKALIFETGDLFLFQVKRATLKNVIGGSCGSSRRRLNWEIRR